MLGELREVVASGNKKSCTISSYNISLSEPLCQQQQVVIILPSPISPPQYMGALTSLQVCQITAAGRLYVLVFSTSYNIPPSVHHSTRVTLSKSSYRRLSSVFDTDVMTSE